MESLGILSASCSTGRLPDTPNPVYFGSVSTRCRCGLRKKNTAGQGLVEFAILLPVLFLFIMIIFDLGRMAYYYSAIHNAAREGARYASIHHSTATASDIAAAASQLVAGLDSSLMTITGSYPTAETVLVIITYDFETATPILSLLLGSDDNMIRLTSRATMQLE